MLILSYWNMFLLLFKTFLCKLFVHTLGSRVPAYLIFFFNWGRFLKSLGTTDLFNVVLLVYLGQ